MFSTKTDAKADAKYSTSRVPAIVVLLGVASLAMLAGTGWIRDRLVTVNMVRLDALVELQLAVATVHLWLEEFVSDDSVDLRLITNGLQRAEDLCHALIEGGTVGEFDTKLPPLKDDEALAAAAHISATLERFAALTSVRQSGYASGVDVGIGSPLDREYDALFAEVTQATRAMETEARRELVGSRRLASLLNAGIVVSWVLVIALAVTALMTREQRRQRIQETLRRKEFQLARARKLEAIGRLAGGITHDINNYLAAITANCELVEMQAEKGSPVAQKMAAALRVSGKISSLIEQLLAFSRRQPSRTRLVNLNLLVDDMGAMLSQLVGKDIDVSTRLADDLWQTRVDPSQVEQILVNLVVNSGQAIVNGGHVAIETANVVLDRTYVASHAGVGAGEYVMLAVSDDGPGIPANIQEQIFEPFFTTKNQASNSGLGLATVYGIVRQSGGHVWLYSEPGKGTVFKIYLPRALADVAGPAEDAQSSSVIRRGDGRILLVEDNDDFRRTAHATLTEIGYDVVATCDGDEAIRVFSARDEEFDLLLTDVVMPGMSGPDLVRRLCGMGGNMPVLYMSGYTGNENFDYGLDDGDIALLQKPFTAHDLSIRVADALVAEDPAAPAAHTTCAVDPEST